MLSFKRQDMLGQELTPGNVCVRTVDDKVELCVYKGGSKGGAKSKGTFGRFITPHGIRSLKYACVAFVYDPLSERRAKTPELTRMVREFYESVR